MTPRRQLREVPASVSARLRNLARVGNVDFLSTGTADLPTIRLRIQNIRRDQPEGGLRARLQGSLGTIRLALQMDIGFGDVITPEREQQDYPILLDLPAPRLWTYPRETVVAEKFEAMVSRDETNSRVKDLWDIACLARRFAFDGETLRTAIAETFRRRGTSFTHERPAALLPGYYDDTARTQHWQVLQQQIATDADGPSRLVDAGDGRLVSPTAAC